MNAGRSSTLTYTGCPAGASQLGRRPGSGNDRSRQPEQWTPYPLPVRLTEEVLPALLRYRERYFLYCRRPLHP